jgi:hypothetical protein
MLFLLVDRQAGRRRFVATHVHDHAISALKAKSLAVRKALDQPNVWFIDLRDDDTAIAAWKGNLADAPADGLPEPK